MKTKFSSSPVCLLEIDSDIETISKMYDFIKDEQTFPLFTIKSGRGRYVGIIHPRDAKKFEEFLKKNGGEDVGVYEDDDPSGSH